MMLLPRSKRKNNSEDFSEEGFINVKVVEMKVMWNYLFWKGIT